jgi:uncharacterized OsmC-like protein
MKTATMTKPKSGTTTSGTQSTPKAPPVPRNGVNAPTLLATIAAVREQPELAKFKFRARNAWLNGTHSQSSMSGFYGAGGEHKHHTVTMADSDHPAVLCGADQAPTPVEWVLHALVSCIMAGIANISAVRGVTLHSVEATIEGDIDLRGILGLSSEVRNGYQSMRMTFDIKGDAPPEKLAEIVEQARARSAVFDVVTNGVPVKMDVNAVNGR